MENMDILGSETKIEIKILKRLYAESIDSWEEDVGKAAISVDIPRYLANFRADLSAEEFMEETFHGLLYL